MVEKVKGTMAGVSVSVLDDVLSSPSVSSDPVSPHRSRGDATGSQQMPQESGSKALGAGATDSMGRPAAANAARERSRVQTLRHAFLELQRTLPSVPPDTKLSKLDVLILATTYIAHLTRSLQEEASPEGGEKADSQLTPGSSSLLQGALQGDGYLHPVKVFPRNWRFAFCCNCVSQFQLVAYRSHFSYTWKPEKWPMRSRLYTGASGQFLNNSPHSDNSNQGKSPTPSRF